MNDEEWERIADLGTEASTDREWFEMATAELREERDLLRDAIGAHRLAYRPVGSLSADRRLWAVLDGHDLASALFENRRSRLAGDADGAR